MANNTLKARLIQASKTEAEWKSSNPVLLKGEVAYSSDKKQRKTGDGSSKWTDITYDKSVPTEHTHNYAGSSSAGGVANSANKLATPRKINGIAFDGTKDINNVIYTTKKDYDTLVKTGTYDKSAMYVTTDEIDDMSKFNTDLLDSSTSLAKQGKYLSYSDQNGGKYLSIKNTTDNSTVAHAKLMDGESGEGMDVDADKVKTIDSKGILVDALGETTAQALIDEVAKRVIDLTGRMSTTETGLQSANEAITSLNSNIKIKFYGKVTDLSVIKTLCQQEYECWVGYIDWKNTEILPSTGGTMLWFAFDWIVCGLCYGKMFYLNMDTLTWS